MQSPSSAVAADAADAAMLPLIAVPSPLPPARRSARQETPSRTRLLNYWDVSGLLTFIGICLAAVIEPEALAQLVAVDDRAAKHRGATKSELRLPRQDPRRARRPKSTTPNSTTR
jgi:hypothetical protein